jgi:hypothetical protein
MKRPALGALITVVVSIVVPLDATLAHYLEWPSWTESIALNTGYTWRTSGDTVRSHGDMYWDSTRGANMRHMGSHGYRFTFDVHDNSYHVNANGWWSALLMNPYYDLDDDTGPGGLYDWKNEEAEITADSASFPGSNVWYYANVYFSYWHYMNCGYAGCGWHWDGRTGTLAYSEQLSEQFFIGGDKWDTTQDFGGQCCAGIGSRTYPAKSIPAGASVATTESTVPGEAVGPPASSAGAPFDAVTTTDPGEVFVRPRLGAGLPAYAAKVRSTAPAIARAGRSRGVITFARPVGIETIQELAAAGVHFDRVEALGAISEAGIPWTVGAPGGPESFDVLEMLAADEGVALDGIVSAEVTIPNAAILQAAQRNADVYLVDLSLEQAARSLGPAGGDLVTNDVYWYLAQLIDTPSDIGH